MIENLQDEGMYVPQRRDCIKIRTEDGAPTEYKNCTLYEVLALVRNRVRQDGISRTVCSSCGYVESFPALNQV